MAHYAIMRGEKRKTGDVRGITAHIARSQSTPNADPEKRHLNYAVVGPSWENQQAINDAIEARTPKKYRKDAVRAIEYIVSASPEWFEANSEKQAALYFERAVDWFQDEFGTQNVVSAVVHNDESSPHMHILVVPLDAETGRLNGKWFFGNKGVLQKRQSRFADHMSPFAVERGKPDPNRKHEKQDDWRRRHESLDEREAAAAAREQQLAALERELSARGDKLASSEKALEQRQAEIDHAGAVLQQRLAAARAAQQQFEQQKAAWIAENRPTLPDMVGHLRHAEMLDSALELAEFVDDLDARGVDIYRYCSENGLTEQGRALLEQHKSVQEQAERFDQAFTPSNSAPGL